MGTEADTCRTRITPKLQAAGWESEPHSIAEQRTFTDGRIIVHGIQGNFPEDKQTAETALLFLQLIMRKLRRVRSPGFSRFGESGVDRLKAGLQTARPAVVVPDGTSKGLGDRRQRVKPAQVLAHGLWLPPIGWQNRLAEVRAELDALKRLQAETATELDALLDRAFKGEF